LIYAAKKIAKCFKQSLSPHKVYEEKAIFNYSRIRLIHHRLIRQFAQFVTFWSVPAESLSFVDISVRQIRYRLIRQFA